MVYWSSCGSDQAVCFEELLVADDFGLMERSDHMVEVVTLFLIMTHVDSVTQNIQLVSISFYSY